MSVVKKIVTAGMAAAIAAPAALAYAPIAFAVTPPPVPVPVAVKPAVNATAARAGEAPEPKDVNTVGTVNTKNVESLTPANERSRGEENRSGIATRVQEMLSVADRDGGIGEEVRDIAHEYASSTERIDSAKGKVEGRPAWLRLIIGSDYKNLGAIRSELSTTRNQINRLSGARDRAVDPTVQADLDAQIAALRDTASTTDAYVKQNESAFSLLGWLFRVVNR